MANGSTRRSFWIDTAMAIAMFILALLSLIRLPQLPDMRPIDAGAYPLIAAQTLSLAWRRRNPVAVLVVVGSAFVIETGLNYPSSWAVFGIAFALYTVGSQLPMRRSLRVGGIAIAVIVAWTGVGVVLYNLPAPFMITVFGFVTFPFILGREARRREQRALAFEARAVRAEIEREQRAAEAVREERSRIARDLHDVVAHQMTVMTIQAAAAGRVIGTDPAKAAEAIGIVEEAGHRALIEMRRLLGLLRTNAEHELVPQPGLAALDSLIAQINDAGLPVRLTVEGAPRALPSGIDLNAYRIIQESLTNAVKHGGPKARAEVLVAYRRDELQIDVSDDGRGAAEALTANGSGHGLIGMRERVALLDGSLSAGPRAGGGYRVRATIPLSSR